MEEQSTTQNADEMKRRGHEGSVRRRDKPCTLEEARGLGPVEAACVDKRRP